MNFRIADTFTDSLAKLTGEEQKSVKTAAFDLQINPANPGFSFHKLDKAKDKNFWSIIALHTKSANRPINCWGRKLRMSMAMLKTDAGLSQCLMVHSLLS